MRWYDEQSDTASLCAMRGPGFLRRRAHPGCGWCCRRGCSVPPQLKGIAPYFRLGYFNSPFAFSVGKSLCAFSKNLCAFSGRSLDNAAVAMSMQRSASSLLTSIAAGNRQRLTGPEVNKGARWWRHGDAATRKRVSWLCMCGRFLLKASADLTFKTQKQVSPALTIWTVPAPGATWLSTRWRQSGCFSYIGHWGEYAWMCQENTKTFKLGLAKGHFLIVSPYPHYIYLLYTINSSVILLVWNVWNVILHMRVFILLLSRDCFLWFLFLFVYLF